MSSEPRALPEPAVAALRRGKKIEAIKLTREATGMDLKDSKEAVEAFLGNDESGVRQAYDAAQPSTSNLTLLVYVVLVTFLIYWFFFRT